MTEQLQMFHHLCLATESGKHKTMFLGQDKVMYETEQRQILLSIWQKVGWFVCALNLGVSAYHKPIHLDIIAFYLECNW